MIEPQELYYLKSILSNLREFRNAVATEHAPSIGTEVLSDNIDWLDCYIEAWERRNRPKSTSAPIKETLLGVAIDDPNLRYPGKDDTNIFPEE